MRFRNSAYLSITTLIFSFGALYFFQIDSFADETPASSSSTQDIHVQGSISTPQSLYILEPNTDTKVTEIVGCTEGLGTPSQILPVFDSRAVGDKPARFIPIAAKGKSYWMGCFPEESTYLPFSYSDGLSNEDRHQVTLTRNFELQSTPVTQKQWSLVMGYNPSFFQPNLYSKARCGEDDRGVILPSGELGCKSLPVKYDTIFWSSHFYDMLPDNRCREQSNEITMPDGILGCALYPVEQINQIEMKQFIAKLNEQHDGCTYFLPTEAEWEFAAKQGGAKRVRREKSIFTSWNDNNEIKKYAWTHENSKNMIHSVGLKNPDKLGLYDMEGNVLQAMQDDYVHHLSEGADEHNGPVQDYVARGSAFTMDILEVTPTFRQRIGFEARSDVVGFRLARTCDCQPGPQF